MYGVFIHVYNEQCRKLIQLQDGRNMKRKKKQQHINDW